MPPPGVGPRKGRVPVPARKKIRRQKFRAAVLGMGSLVAGCSPSLPPVSEEAFTQAFNECVAIGGQLQAASRGYADPDEVIETCEDFAMRKAMRQRDREMQRGG